MSICQCQNLRVWPFWASVEYCYPEWHCLWGRWKISCGVWTFWVFAKLWRRHPTLPLLDKFIGVFSLSMYTIHINSLRYTHGLPHHMWNSNGIYVYMVTNNVYVVGNRKIEAVPVHVVVYVMLSSYPWEGQRTGLSVYPLPKSSNMFIGTQFSHPRFSQVASFGSS